MLGIDAQIDLPRVCSTFTTRDRVEGPAHLRELSAQIVRLIRSELPGAKPVHILEFTTGEGTNSGGVRRPHLHSLWKGVEAQDSPVIAGCAGHVLERATGAWSHDVGEIRSPGGVVSYVARHHLKESQAPPPTWGATRRIRPSKGYYSLPAVQLRSMARSQVQQIGVWKRLESEAPADLPEDVLDRYLECRVDEALAAPPPQVVRVCQPWEDPLAA
jgi:hypothetical protein